MKISTLNKIGAGNANGETGKYLPVLYDSNLFSGGEVNLKVINYRAFGHYEKPVVKILARITSSNDLFQLALAKNALQNIFCDAESIFFDVIIPYLPYARQDRICNAGESFSLKVICDFVNSLGFNKVTILDPHSDVAPALLNNVKIVKQREIISKWNEFCLRVSSCTFVSPDAGSNKKTQELTNYFCHERFIRADKLRDTNTGEIKETIVYTENFNGRDICVFDDIIDGGKTFVELAKVCKAKNCGKFVLYATHGIFSKGIETLLNNGIDEIWTTNSFKEKYSLDNIDLIDKLHVFDIDKII